MEMPPLDSALLARRAEIAAALRTLVAAHDVVDDPASLRVFESDALSAYSQMPLVAVLPSTTAEVAAVVRWCAANGMRIVARGAGTSLSGGALPVGDAVLLVLAKLNRIVEIDLANRCVVAQPGVTNLGITRAVEGRGFYYAPDPSSQIACSIGGNVAENSGGVHCLKYGLTTNNVLGVELVLPDGEIVRIGGKAGEADGLDLLSVVVGSEGLLGIVTEVTVRILPAPQTARALLLGFAEIGDAARCVAAIIAAGIIPAGLELMDGAAARASDDFVHAGYPAGVAALLIVELDGPEAECGYLVGQVEAIAAANRATSIAASRDEAERLRFWAGRKAAFPAMARLAPDYLCLDGTIPRRELADVLAAMEQLSAEHGLDVVNVFHAGDGNLHPLILYDLDRPGDLERAEAFGADILRLCVRSGGVLSGEHGIGVEKRDLMCDMFGQADLDQQRALKAAFDPAGMMNPGKVFPLLHRCAEGGRMHVRHGRSRFPDLPRF